MNREQLIADAARCPQVLNAARKNAPRGLAEDAIQTAVCLCLEKMPDAVIDHGKVAAYMVVCVKRECWQMRRKGLREQAFSQLVDDDHEDYDPLSAVPDPGRTVEECGEDADAIARRMAAVAQLKPQEKLALWLHETGFTYREIEEITGWTYTKVNRCMAEGRARAFKLLGPEQLDAERLSPVDRRRLAVG